MSIYYIGYEDCTGTMTCKSLDLGLILIQCDLILINHMCKDLISFPIGSHEILGGHEFTGGHFNFVHLVLPLFEEK